MRQRGGVTVAWAIVASLHALPACWLVRVGLPPPRPPTGDTPVSPSLPLVEGRPLFVDGLPSPAPSPPWQRVASWVSVQVWTRVRVPSVLPRTGPLRRLPPHPPILWCPVGACVGRAVAFRLVRAMRPLHPQRVVLAAPGLRPRRPLLPCLHASWHMVSVDQAEALCLEACRVGVSVPLPSSACVGCVPPPRRGSPSLLSPLFVAVACRRRRLPVPGFGYTKNAWFILWNRGDAWFILWKRGEKLVFSRVFARPARRPLLSTLLGDWLGRVAVYGFGVVPFRRRCVK